MYFDTKHTLKNYNNSSPKHTLYTHSTGKKVVTLVHPFVRKIQQGYQISQ